MLNDIQDRVRRFVSGAVGTTGLQKLILRASTGTLGVKIVGAGLAFLMQIVLTRTLGAEQYGVYIYALTWAQLVALVGAFGFPTASVRFVSEYRGQKSYTLLNGFLRFSRRLALILSLALGGAMGAIAAWLYTPSAMLYTFWGAALLPIAQSTLAVRLAEIKGMQHIVVAYAIDQIVRPVIVIVTVGGVVWLGKVLVSYEAMGIYVGGTAMSALLAMWVGYKVLPKDLWGAGHGEKNSQWFAAARDMVLIAGFNLVLFRADTIMVGSLIGTTEAGLYTIASRISGLMAFMLVAVNSSIGPIIADAYAKEEYDEMKSTITFGARIVFACSFGAAIFLFVTGEWILSLFGPEYTKSFWVMMTLVIGQIANAWAGPAMLALNMTGFESVSARIQIGVAVLNLVLNIALILLFGVIGAAVATGMSIFIKNAIAIIMTKKYLNIDSSFIGNHID